MAKQAPAPIDVPPEAALLEDVAWLSAPARGGRRAGEPGDVDARNWLGERFASLGLSPLGDARGWFQRFSLGGEKTSANVIGWLPGETEKWLLVGAHLDHLGVDEAGRLFPGADDNASGIAAMLGIAAAAAKDQTRQAGILFVGFGAEELGLLGSRWLAEHLPQRAADCLGVINMDMVGRSPFLGAAPYALPKAVLGIEPGPAVGALGNPPNNVLLAVAREACAAVGLELYAAEDFPRLEGRIRDEAANRSDDAPFAAIGLPTLFFSTSLQDDYHQPTDTIEKIDAKTLHRITRCIWLTVSISGGSKTVVLPQAPADAGTR